MAVLAFWWAFCVAVAVVVVMTGCVRGSGGSGSGGGGGGSPSLLPEDGNLLLFRAMVPWCSSLTALHRVAAWDRGEGGREEGGGVGIGGGDTVSS